MKDGKSFQWGVGGWDGRQKDSMSGKNMDLQCQGSHGPVALVFPRSRRRSVAAAAKDASLSPPSKSNTSHCSLGYRCICLNPGGAWGCRGGGGGDRVQPRVVPAKR